MVWDGGRFRPASSFSNQMTVTAPRGGLGALGAASGSLNIGSRGGGSSGMTGGGGSYVSPGQATVPTEEEQYNIRKNAVHKALKELAKAVVSARAFDYGASGLTTEQKQQAVTDAREELEKLGVTRDEIEAYNASNVGQLSPRLGKGNIVDTAKDFLADATQSVYEGIDTGFETFGALTGLGDPDQVGPTVPWGVGGQWGATGKQTPVRIGTAKDGTPIVLYIPGGGILGGAQQAAQQGGGLWDIVKGGVAGAGGVGGIATTAATTAALNAADNLDDKATTKGKVLLNPGALGDESTSGETGVIDTDQVKTTGVDTNTGGAGTDAIVTGGAGTDTTLTGGGQDVSLGTAGLAASDIINTGGDSFSLGTGGRDTDTIKTGGDSFSIETLGRDTDTIKTGGYEAWLEEAGLEPAAEKVAEKVAEKTGGGGAAGGSGLPVGGSGIAEVAGEPGDLVEIKNYVDMADSLDAIIAQRTQEEDEDELLFSASGGGAVKRFDGRLGSDVKATNQAKLGSMVGQTSGVWGGSAPAEEKGNIFQKGLPAIIGGGLGALFGLTDQDDPNPSGYQGGIPEYKYNRSLVPNAFSNVLDPLGNRIDPLTATETSTIRRPGSAGRSYFTEGAYDPIMETVDGVGVQSTLGGAQRRADAVAAAAQAKEDEDYISQIGQDFLDLQPVDNTATAGTGSVVDAGAGAGVVDAGAVDTGAGGVDLTGGAGVDTVGADTVTDFQKFNTFLAPFYNKVLNNEDFLALGGSGYEVSQLAAALGVDGQKLFDAIANATNVSGAFNKDAVDYLTNTGSGSTGGAGDDTVEVSDLQKFSNFLTPFYNRDLTTQDILALGNSGYSVSQLAQALGIKGSDLTAAIANAEALSSAFNATAENSASSADTTNVDDTLIQVSNPNILVQEEINDLVARINAQELTVADVAAKYGLTDQQVQNEVDRINLSNINAVDEAGVEYLLSEINAGNLTVADVATRYGLTEKEVQDTVNALNKQAMTDVILDAASANTIAANADDLFVDTDFTDFNIFGSGGAGNEGFQRPLASGGMLHGDGYYLGGTTDGMADQVPATIGGQEPARLSDGEFVVPADVVSHLGNGNSDAGATQLYSMMDRVRKKRTGTTQQGAEINPMQQLPA